MVIKEPGCAMIVVSHAHDDSTAFAYLSIAANWSAAASRRIAKPDASVASCGDHAKVCIRIALKVAGLEQGLALGGFGLKMRIQSAEYTGRA